MQLPTIKQCFIALIVCVGFSGFHAFAEAPVVDVQEDSSNTQTESTGTGWQTMQESPSDNDNGQANTASNNTASNTNDTPIAHDDQSDASANTNTNTSSNTSSQANNNAPDNQRLARVEQQVSNMSQMNLPQQINDMRQSISQLQGQLEIAQRNLKTLTDQQNRYYQDLSQQIAEVQKKKPAAVASNDDATASAATAAAPTAPSAVTPTASASKSAPTTLADSDAYSKAFRLLSTKQYDQAKTAFLSYLKNYPNGDFSANAHYWLGEIAMQKNDNDGAFSQFQTVISQYSTSDKVADAKLKVAMIHAATGKSAVAKIEFQKIKAAYPGSTAAQLAGIQLQQLGNNT